MKSRMPGALLASFLAIGLAACTVEQTEEGELPEIDPGELPEYEVQPPPAIDVERDTITIQRQDVEIDTTPPDTIYR